MFRQGAERPAWRRRRGLCPSDLGRAYSRQDADSSAYGRSAPACRSQASGPCEGLQDRAMKLLVFQHIACEHPGIFRRFLAADGISWETIELDRGDAIPPLENYGMLWVM